MECNEDCNCPACLQERAVFDAWVADTENRWDRAYREGRVAHKCGPLTCRGRCPKEHALTAPSGLVEGVQL